MKEAINSGMQSKELSMSGMCGDDCAKLQKRFEKENSMFGRLFEDILEYALLSFDVDRLLSIEGDVSVLIHRHASRPRPHEV